jgi:iron complex outermembrane receptor protein
MGIDYSSHIVSAQLSLFANHIANFIFLQRMAAADEAALHESNEESLGYDAFRYTSGTARLWGGEASVVVHPFKRLHIENTFSYVATRLLHQEADSRYLPYTPQPRWTTNVRCDLLRQCRHVSNSYASVGLECHLKQDRVHTANDTEMATPSYTLLNAAAGTDVLRHGKTLFTVCLTANNLLNRAYQNHLSRLKYADVNNATGRRGVFNMGRNIGVKVIVPIVL